MRWVASSCAITMACSNPCGNDSFDAGSRRTLNNVAGNPVRAWDDRGFIRRFVYDALQRPLELYVSDGTGNESLAEKMVYGESMQDPQAGNHRLKLWKTCDGSGVLTCDSYDFKGNLLRSTRQMLADYKNGVDWAQAPELADEIFTGSTRYDAMNRPVQTIAPHSNRAGARLKRGPACL